ncbi:MAG TPA: metallophosphoesterase [Candidatus Methylomirabilis sp.]|nr:metallophosphoesterase [Candidatus Methylomirabilis sp.]
MPVPIFRLIAVALTFFAQGYLFLRIRQGIESSQRSDRLKSWALRLVGGAMILLFILNGYTLLRHVPWADPPIAVQVGLFYPMAVWNLGSLLSALVLFLARLAGRLGKRVACLPRPQVAQTSPDVVDLSRRRFLQAGVGGLAAAPMLLSGYGAVYAATSYDVEELALPFGRSLRVVQLTDIHAGIYMSREQIRRYAEQVIALQPDLFVLTGDFISNSTVFLPSCLEELSRVRARYGTFAILGNHEHHYGQLSQVLTMFRQYRIPLLNNAHQVIQAEQGALAVVGIDDLYTGFPDLDAALDGLSPAIPTLLLSHRPEIFPQAAERGIPLTLSGHWHGGQIKLSLPGMDVSLAHLRSPYPEGLYRINSSHLYVSRGIGTTFTPVRLNAPPEVTLFHLV